MEVLHMFLFKRFTKLKDTNNDDDNYDDNDNKAK